MVKIEREREREREKDLEIVKFGEARLALCVHYHHRTYHLLLYLASARTSNYL